MWPFGTWAQATAIVARRETVSTLLRQQRGTASEIAGAARTELASADLGLQGHECSRVRCRGAAGGAAAALSEQLPRRRPRPLERERDCFAASKQRWLMRPGWSGILREGRRPTFRRDGR
ncbi:unnamed protein product [Pedinophyceae sp. YPF-701]|nr:unnamed protein product [Pedinophyceae sp. YPF-701]